MRGTELAHANGHIANNAKKNKAVKEWTLNAMVRMEVRCRKHVERASHERRWGQKKRAWKLVTAGIEQVVTIGQDTLDHIHDQ